VIVVSSFGPVSATVKSSSSSREVSHHGLFGEVEYIEWWDQGFKAPIIIIMDHQQLSISKMQRITEYIVYGVWTNHPGLLS